MKLPFLSPRPSVPTPKPSTPARVATPKPSAPAPVASSFKPAAPVNVAPADRLAATKAFLLNQPDPMAAKERQLSMLAAHLPPGPDRDGVREQVTALRTAAKQKLMTDLETVAVQQLPKDQKEQYLALTQDLKGANEPVARLSLQTMLIDGKLDPRVLSGLNGLLTQPMAPGIDRHQLLADLTTELADPSNIRQGDHVTCAAVSASLMLLQENPAEYVRVVAGLASPGGAVTLESGATLNRVDVSFSDDRSAVQRLVAPAMMDAAAPEGLSYDGKHGYFTNAHGQPVNEKGQVVSEDHAQRRLPAEWTSRLLGRALDGRFQSYDVGSIATGAEQAAALKVILSASGRGPVAVSVEGADFDAQGLHSVVVQGLSADKKSVTYLDPNGAQHEMPLDTFMGAIRRFSADSLTKSELQTWASGRGSAFQRFFEKPAEALSSAVENLTGADDDGGRTTKPGGGTNG